MRLVAIGDIHGRSVWKSIVKSESYDKVIFIGDYFDSKERILAKTQKRNFGEIIQYKKLNPDKVVLLIGNHAFHYLKNIGSKWPNVQRYNGFQASEYKEIQVLLEEAIADNILQVCYTIDKFLFVHAGVTKLWFKMAFEREYVESLERHCLQDTLADRFKIRRVDFGFIVGPMCNPDGDNPYQSPLWVRPDSLIGGTISGFTQVVGHTVQKTIRRCDDVVFIDTLSTSGEYLVIDNGSFVPTPVHSKRVRPKTIKESDW